MDKELELLSSQIGRILTIKGLSVSAAESCTGGLLSHVLTNVSGSSQYFVGGVVAYSNQIKESILGVSPNTLLQHGAVSKETACEMAAGIREKFGTDIGLSTTGVAGPTGGTPTKPVGLVWIGFSTQVNTHAIECHFKGGRDGVKINTVEKILTLLLEDLEEKNESVK